MKTPILTRQLKLTYAHWGKGRYCCAIAPSVGLFISRLPLATVTLSTEGWRGHSFLFIWLLWKIVEMRPLYNQEPLWQHISFHSMLNNCRHLCYVWVWRWECEAEQKLRVIFVFSFIETVLQLLRACIFMTVCFELVRCWPHWYILVKTVWYT